MVVRDWSQAPGAAVRLGFKAWSRDGKAHRLNISITSSDYLENPLSWHKELTLDVPADNNPAAAVNIPFDGGLRYYAFKANVTTEDGTVRQLFTDIGFVPPPVPGARPDSFFASNTSTLKVGTDLDFLNAVGIKVQRGHFWPEIKSADPNWAQRPPSGKLLKLDFTKLDKNWAEVKAKGGWYIPMAGYTWGDNTRTPEVQISGAHGPPRDVNEFVSNWATVLKHYPEITTWECWNEPWVYGWTWFGTGADYRILQEAWCEMALKVNPRLRIIAGESSCYVRDHIEPFPECWKGLLQGLTHHPYNAVGDASYRGGQNLRALDDMAQVFNRMGLTYNYLTEGGTEYGGPMPPEEQAAVNEIAAIKAAKAALSPDRQRSPEAMAMTQRLDQLSRRVSQTFPNHFNNPENACKVVQYFVNAALLGYYQGNIQYGIGYCPDLTIPDTALGVLTHFLEDRPIAADIWPRQELITGAIFANSRLLTDEVKSLPRGRELESPRWRLPVPPERAGDTTKVAVFWSLTGPSGSQLDSGGTLSLDAGPDLRAFDILGHPISAVDGKLVVPFSQYPSYIISDKLSVIELYKRIGGAKFERLTPLNACACSLLVPADRKQPLTVRVQNQINRDLNATVTLRISGVAEPISVPVKVPAGALVDATLPWPGVNPSANNQYAVTLEAQAGDSPALMPFKKQQLLSQATFAKRSIPMTGSLDDWKGITPVLLDSRLLDNDVDLTTYVLNPRMERPTEGDASRQRIVARVYTAYDDANVYLAAAVNEDHLHCDAGGVLKKGRGEAKVAVPFKEGVPDGINHIAMCGDSLQFSFGFRDRVPSVGRQMNDPWAWKGNFYDTDYSYAANVSTGGDMLVRLWGPTGVRRDAYQCEEKTPGVGPVPGGRVKIVRDEPRKLTLYEIAIPRDELKLFDPSAGRMRFGFVLNNDEGLNPNSGLNWSDAAGVFDYWRGQGSTPPQWLTHNACQTFFGIEN